MANENWLDPEWGTSGLSGFNTSRIPKLSSTPGMSSGLDMLEMTKSIVEEFYESKRPNDGVSGTLVGIVVHSEHRNLDSITDPIIREMSITTDEITNISGIRVVYVAPAGGSCSMLPRPMNKNDKASIYRFPRFYAINVDDDTDPIPGRPCEVSYIDEDTLSFGLFHGMLPSGPSAQEEDFLYRGGADRQFAQTVFKNRRSKLVKNLTSSKKESIKQSLVGKFYHTSVVKSNLDNPIFGETGGGRIRNNIYLSVKNSVEALPSEGYRGKVHRLERSTYLAYKAMVEAATRDGISAPMLQITSGLRDYEHQKELWEKALKNPKNIKKAKELGLKLKDWTRKRTAPPGRSRHHSGRAIDLYLGYPISQIYQSKMKATPAFAWLLENADFYGFYNYEPAPQKQNPGEPWHWEFNPDTRVGRSQNKK